MRRIDRCVLAHRPYALDMDSLRVDDHGVAMDAVWFRRRRGVTVACIGHLWDIQRPAPISGLEFLERHDDGRYGGRCEGRWDGVGYWGAEAPELVQAHLRVLQPMLHGYPNVPDGYDGWWTFKPEASQP